MNLVFTDLSSSPDGELLSMNTLYGDTIVEIQRIDITSGCNRVQWSIHSNQLSEQGAKN